MRILNVPYLVFDAVPRWQHKAVNCYWLERHVVINVTLIIVCVLSRSGVTARLLGDDLLV